MSKNIADLRVTSRVAGVNQRLSVRKEGDLAISLRDTMDASSSGTYEVSLKSDEVNYLSAELAGAGSIRFWNSTTADEYTLTFPEDGLWYWYDGMGVGNPIAPAEYDRIDITNSETSAVQFSVFGLTDEGFTPTLPPGPTVPYGASTITPVEDAATATFTVDADSMSYYGALVSGKENILEVDSDRWTKGYGFDITLTGTGSETFTLDASLDVVNEYALNANNLFSFIPKTTTDNWQGLQFSWS